MPALTAGLKAKLSVTEPVTIDDIPPSDSPRLDDRRTGRCGCACCPPANIGTAAAMKTFTERVQAVAPSAAGAPASVTGAGKAILLSFAEAIAYTVDRHRPRRDRASGGASPTCFWCWRRSRVGGAVDGGGLGGARPAVQLRQRHRHPAADRARRGEQHPHRRARARGGARGRRRRTAGGGARHLDAARRAHHAAQHGRRLRHARRRQASRPVQHGRAARHLDLLRADRVADRASRLHDRRSASAPQPGRCRRGARRPEWRACSSPAAAASSAGISSRRSPRAATRCACSTDASRRQPARRRRLRARIGRRSRRRSTRRSTASTRLPPRRHRASLAARQGRLRPRQPARHGDRCSRPRRAKRRRPRRALLDGIDPACRSGGTARRSTNPPPPALDDMPGPYTRSKYLGEQAALEAARDGMDVVVVNPTVPVGDGDRNMTPPTRDDRAVPRRAARRSSSTAC